MTEIHPGLLLILSGLVIAVLPRRALAPTTLVATVVALWLTWNLSEGDLLTHGFYGQQLTLLEATALSRPFALVFATLGVVASIYGWNLMNRVERTAGLATLGAGLGVVLAGDLLSLFLFWEFKVITVVLLLTARGRASATAASRRYLQTHLLGGVVLLGGILWQRTRTGSLALEGLVLDGPGWLILLGLLVGAAAIPLHAWLPDAYPVASLSGAVILSAVTTKSAVYALARMMPGWDLLIWVGVSMAVVGVTLALLQDDLRRLLSYHIISQVGFMIAAIGVGTPTAINGATAHATAHVLYKGLLMMAVGSVIYATGHGRASALGGLASRLPLTLLLYMVGALSISGMIGFSGFPAKELAVYSVGAGGETLAQWALKFASVGTFLSVGLKLPLLVWAGPSQAAPSLLRRPPIMMYAAMILAAVANLAIGVRPQLLFGLLPAPESFTPFTAAKITESLALLCATGCAFWLWRSRLGPKATTTLDLDVVQRELPRAVRARLTNRPRRVVPAAITSTLGLTRSGLSRISEVRAVATNVAPGWLIGGSVAGAMVMIMGVTLLGLVVISR